MSETNEIVQEQKPHAAFLDEDMSQVDTSMPVLDPNPLYVMNVTEVVEEPTKGGDKMNLVIKMKTTAEARSTKDEVINAGFPLTCRICITPTDKLTVDAIKKRVAVFVQAMGGKGLYPLSQWTDKTVYVKLKLRKARTDAETGETYDENVEVKTFLKPEDAK